MLSMELVVFVNYSDSANELICLTKPYKGVTAGLEKQERVT